MYVSEEEEDDGRRVLVVFCWCSAWHGLGWPTCHAADESIALALSDRSTTESSSGSRGEDKYWRENACCSPPWEGEGRERRRRRRKRRKGFHASAGAEIPIIWKGKPRTGDAEGIVCCGRLVICTIAGERERERERESSFEAGRAGGRPGQLAPERSRSSAAVVRLGENCGEFRGLCWSAEGRRVGAGKIQVKWDAGRCRVLELEVEDVIEAAYHYLGCRKSKGELLFDE
ncbi:hypothetical protein AXG93_4010s1010 [Marchantia polymorpha subsp. ruderalis]|uniref:Uncharacterized protein n=1 Tax=Marchantia polymorpha subsp. ruderalis TaxID=1480154 RepID=A0A176VH82_MARPO|nr:hypothetical protein AXG93_4010s1010 [Marchantia polymorpha subsp. ruderalis]